LTPKIGGDIIKNEFKMDRLSYPSESIKQTKPDCLTGSRRNPTLKTSDLLPKIKGRIFIMRNLKKLLAVILSVVMIASMMVPALAANTYEAEALKLQAINVFAGGPEDLKLDEGVTRIQGLTFAIRAAGKDAEALAMDDAEVAEILADWTDAASIPEWGRKYAAYAIKNGITVGLSATQKIFGALNPISGTSFLVFIMKSGMGYADVTTADVIDAAVNAGILTPNQAVTFGAKEALIRDDAAGILYGAFTTGVNADGTKLIDAYIASGATTKEAAAAAGFVVKEEVPEELDVASVEAANLKQIVVELTNTDYDKDDIEDESNYKFKGVVNKKDKQDVAIADASVDGTTLTLTLAKAVDNQSEGTLTIKKGAIGKEVVVEDIEFFDTTLPEIVDAKVIGKDTVKVKFSEPINFEETGDPLEADAKYESEFSFKLNGKSYSVDKIYVLDNGKTANVKVFGSFKDGTLTMKVDNGLEDYAGFNLVAQTIELDVVEDKEAPYVVGFEDAKIDGVTLIFNEDIQLKQTGTSYYYHTNTGNTIDASGVSVDGNKLKLKFSTNKLPEGTAYIYIKAEALADLWGNKNPNTIKALIEVTLDETAPEVKEIKATNDSIKITFTEELDSTSAQKTTNYTITDKDGEKVSIRRAVYSENSDDEGVVTLTPRETLEDGEYTITIKNVEDKANNVMDEYTDTFVLDDETPPTIDDDTAYIDVVDHGDKEYEITILFDEEMAVDGKYSVLDLANYTIYVAGKGMKTLEWVNDQDDYSVEIEAIDNNETVVITIEGLPLVTASGDPVTYSVATAYAGSDKFVVGRVADVAGNYTGLVNNVTFAMKSAKTIGLDSAKATGKKTIEVKFASNLQNPEIQDFIVKSFDGTVTYDIESLDIIDADEIILNLDKELPADVGGASTRIKLFTSNEPESENNSGMKLTANDWVYVDDKIAPSVKLEDDVNTDVKYDDRTLADNDEDDVPAVYAEYTAATTSSVIYIIFDEDIAGYIAHNVGLFKVNNGDNKVTEVTVTGAKVAITVEGEVVKGDKVDVTAIYDIAGNGTKDLALNIEYLVEIK